MIVAAKFTDETRQLMAVEYDTGEVRHVPSDPDNSECAEMTASGITVAPFDPPPPTADDVRAEAQRRIIETVGASNMNACVVKQLNALMRATELASKGPSTWTAAEAAEAAALQRMADAVKAIRAASNTMEPNPPPDYQDNSRWPALP